MILANTWSDAWVSAASAGMDATRRRAFPRKVRRMRRRAERHRVQLQLVTAPQDAWGADAMNASHAVSVYSTCVLSDPGVS